MLVLAISCSGGDSSARGAATNSALSLRVLQEMLKECEGAAPDPLESCSMQVRHLALMTRIDGFAIDTENKDIILLGRKTQRYATRDGSEVKLLGCWARDDECQALHVEDLVIAMRNRWQKYLSLDVENLYRSPGCSIDPSPDVLRGIEELGVPTLRERGQAAASEEFEAWYRMAGQPQAVRVIGIPASRAAATMVDADFLLKRITNGSENPGQGFRSLMDMRISQLTHSNNAVRRESQGSLNRFWFHPARDIRVVVGASGALIKGVSVGLSTEEEHLTSSAVVGTGKADPLAKEFATAFTDAYPQMKRTYPIYGDLENLFWLVALAQVIRQTDAETQSGLDLSYLLDRLRLPGEDVPTEVRGVSRVQTIAIPDNPGLWERLGRLFKRETVATTERPMRLTLAGGVSSGINLTKEHIMDDKDGQWATVVAAATRARPDNPTLSWAF